MSLHETGKKRRTNVGRRIRFRILCGSTYVLAHLLVLLEHKHSLACRAHCSLTLRKVCAAIRGSVVDRRGLFCKENWWQWGRIGILVRLQLLHLLHLNCLHGFLDCHFLLLLLLVRSNQLILCGDDLIGLGDRIVLRWPLNPFTS